MHEFMHEFKILLIIILIGLLLCCFYVLSFNEVLCPLLFYDKMFVQEWDYNVYDYFIHYKPLYRPNSKQ